MKNRVTEVFSSMSDMDLMKALVEMREDEPKGVFRQDGVVRDICQKIHDIIGGNTYEHSTLVVNSIYKEAAYRFQPKVEEEDFLGRKVWRHRHNKNLFIIQSYGWVDNVTLTDESDGRQIIMKFKASTFDFTNWVVLTKEQELSVVDNYREIYTNGTL
jgi:hypothetical protein